MPVQSTQCNLQEAPMLRGLAAAVASFRRRRDVARDKRRARRVQHRHRRSPEACCHCRSPVQTASQSGTPAPMSLMTYQRCGHRARSLKQRVSAREMPPWHINRSIGEYSPDPSLSDDEITTIAAWAMAARPKALQPMLPALTFQSGMRNGPTASLISSCEWRKASR